MTTDPSPTISVAPGVDPLRWPDIARIPHDPARARVAGLLLRNAARRAGVELRHGTSSQPAGDGPAMTLVREQEVLSRLGRDRLIGLGESWMSGAWQTEDLPAVLLAFAEHLTELVPRPLRALRRLFERPFPASEDADRQGARRNVARHYDLSNDLFATFLGPTMTYSSAMFAAGDDLERGQIRKTDAVLDAAGVGPGTHLLEIGCGWGGLAIRAARRGATVTALTLSAEQKAYAERRIHEQGLGDRIEIRLQDYREVRGQYSAIASVEMLEAVGERHWPAYFRTLGALLAPGGQVALQTITMPHDHMMATKRSWTWMHKYIFPGGLIPSTTAIHRHARDDGGLRIVADRSFGHDYAETLRIWRERFSAAADDVAELGFDQVFRRMWEFYLAYCEAGFRSGRISVNQLVLEAT